MNHPTCSYKDRVVSVAATRAVELGFTMFACASTGNLAGSVASHAARLGLSCAVFIPDDLEPAKVTGASVYRPQIIAVRGNYDDVNRLCTQVADRYGWGFANINLRQCHAEGAKTFGFEIAEQLGWRFPRHVVSPVAGGTLLPRILKGFEELRTVGLVSGELPSIYAAQAAGCAPVIRALDAGLGSRIPSSRRRSRNLWRSAIPRTASRCSGRCARQVAAARWLRTTRSSPASSCLPRRKHLHRARRRHDRRGNEEADRARVASTR